MDDGRETNQEDDNYSLSELKNSCFNLMFKIEDGFVQDEENYEKAIKAFIKQEEKNCLQIQQFKRHCIHLLKML